MKNFAIVLAAGEGSRMKVHLPKCAHLILRKPMAQYVVDAINNDQIKETLLVIDNQSKNIFEEIFSNHVKYVIQENHLGSGDALRVALPLIDDEEGFSLVLPGDVPLIDKE